ncbi:MAG TPA: DNA topoisomerase VI subunit B [Candidatus Thermoplasmatota archaeon]|nr:DNA topoisomerase VI subunit B [Candidatus Thermoplasmatota archaeon]
MTAKAEATLDAAKEPAKRKAKAPIAEELALGQKEISVAEFFERNRQILGFDSPVKALITAIKEAVDNSLDACEEAGILPDIGVEVHKGTHADELRVVVEDNGPGIVQRQMPNIFARLLYGSRFHAIRQSRGQQGIGISAVVLYGQLTTGHRATVTSKIGVGHPAVRMELGLDTKKNQPEVHSTAMDETWTKEHGTRIEVVLKAKFQGGRQSAYEFLRATSIVNPHARITFLDPTGQVTVFERVTDEVPPATRQIKPHPYGTELGTILKMAKDAKERKLTTFLTDQFSSVGTDTAKRILEAAELENVDPKDLKHDEVRRLHEAFPKVKIMAPPTDCLSPIGEQLVRRGLKKETEDVSPEFITTVTRPPSVWGGHPFQVEVGIVYGGTLPAEESVRILRFANRVPLLYQGGGCASTVAVQDVDWRRYGLEQRGGKGMPNGPAIVLVHVASTKVPFTSEAKEAIAPIEEIHREVKLALQEAARHLGRHLAKKAKRAKVSEKFTLVSKILPEINRKAASVLGKPEADLAPIVCKIMDVVWIEDPVVEYTKLEGQVLAPEAPKVQRDEPKMAEDAQEAPAKKGKARKGDRGTATLDSFEEAPPEAGGDAPAAPAEPPKPRQAYLAASKLSLTNYMMGSKKFRLYVVLPDRAVFAGADPAPKAVHERYVMWEVPPLKPTEKLTLAYQVAGVDKGGMDDVETFVEGINEIHVVGADPWHGGE